MYQTFNYKIQKLGRETFFKIVKIQTSFLNCLHFSNLYLTLIWWYLLIKV